MSTLSYYERYREYAARAAAIEGILQFSFGDGHREYEEELKALRLRMREIEESLEHYIPYDLPPRLHYRALEERAFLFYRCIKGFTLSRTAELMCVSRDTVYRIRRRLAKKEGSVSTALDDFPYGMGSP